MRPTAVAAVGALLALLAGLVVIDPDSRIGAQAADRPKIGDGRGGIRKHKIGSFDSPTYVTHAPGAQGFLYVVERAGRVRVVKHGNVRGQPFLDIHSRVTTQGERGLLSIAFDPRYPKNHLFYAYYTNDDGNIEIDEFRAGSNTDANEGSRRTVIVVPHPIFSNHNGGQVQFGADGKLYAATGEGGNAGDNAQNKHLLLGKLLRINPHQHGSKPYKVPRGNPYVGRPGRNEIFALGLRNPFRFSFDRGRIAIGDVGQNAWEEVDREGHKSLRGANFGWNHFEGDHVYASGTPRPRHHYEPPIFEYPHTDSNCESFGGCAITGGDVVRDRKLRSLYGRYLYADFYAGKLRSFVPHRRRGRRDRALGVHVDHPTSFSEGAHRRIYVTSIDGPVYKLVHR